ncbi:MAG: hypothetical protein AVDCRST_MAG19-1479 [uncultured Thermomicrobiales bacterium]|uniref:phosphoribosylaminoimidazolesuccinocarboxamide synthase n=1 Tax=uncultured Thermomicrobiales bacterium TaxID=1645740 RepID=A0A6J4UXN8_9BACT|nr:MAG: hypothetical protein AVDCRST_MAG19-1479 [uncultured Thermomicrobiales bacterium]
MRERPWVRRCRRACRAAHLPAPLRSPALKDERPRDVSISPAESADLVGVRLRDRIVEASRDRYGVASDLAMRRGIVGVVLGFEFGLIDGELVLIEDLVTPDRSRFWGTERFRAEGGRERFDNQDPRDWLEGSDWERQPPGPPLPNEVGETTDSRYAERYRRLIESPLLPVRSEEE